MNLALCIKFACWNRRSTRRGRIRIRTISTFKHCNEAFSFIIRLRMIRCWLDDGFIVDCRIRRILVTWIMFHSPKRFAQCHPKWRRNLEVCAQWLIRWHLRIVPQQLIYCKHRSRLITKIHETVLRNRCEVVATDLRDSPIRKIKILLKFLSF